MSVSIDDKPADEHEGADESARGVLTGWLDDYAAGRCERADMEEAFMSVCTSDPEAPWDAIALLDQYQRLGRIDAELARTLKSQITQLAVGAPKQRSRRDEEPARAESGTRWRKPGPPSEADTLNADDIEAPGPDPGAQPTPSATRSQPVHHSPDDSAGDLDEQEDEAEDSQDDDSDDEAADAVPMPPETIFRDPSAFERKWPELQRKRPKPSERAEPRPRTTPPPSFSSSLPPQPAKPAPTPRAAAPEFDTSQRKVSPARPAAAPAPAASSKRVLRDRYELLGVLARGASSTVYKALDRHRANLTESARYVAIKVLDADFEGRPDALAELEREFHQAQSLSHPNIASVFDLDRDGRTYFIVMELLEGDLLSNILRRLDGKPMARGNALALIGSIGAALAHAHRRDVVHGDLKPRNVMITDMGEVRVLEFGFAHSRGLQAGELDAAHEVSIGTPAYASAERVHGVDPTPSDDVYSLACIAYELLSGRHPYGGRSAVLARAHGKKPQRISGLSNKQWHALQRALAWDRAERKIDVVDLLAALGTADAPKDTAPPALLALPDDGTARRRRVWGMVALIVCAVALAVYFVTRIPPPVQNADLSSVAPAPAVIDETSSPPSTSSPSASPPAQKLPSEEVVAPAERTAATSASTPAKAPPSTTPAPRATPKTEEAREPEVQQPQASAASESSTPAPPPSPPARTSTIQFSKDTFVVTESEPAVTLDVTRTGSTREEVTFRWIARSNSAEAGSDFAAIGPGVERIPAGSRSATILIPLVNDSIVENTELFLVELEVIDGSATIGELGHAAVIIVDDD